MRIHPETDLHTELLSVEKPGRYVGGEYGSHDFDASAVMRIAVCFPDVYEIGMSNRALKIMYNLFESVDGIACERVFAAAPDLADLALDRTFTVTDGQLTPMAQPDSRNGITSHYGPAGEATENLIIVASKRPGYVAAQWWEGAPTSVGGNCHPSIACIHAPPSFGTLEPGHSATRRGRLYLMPGTPEDAYQRYRNDTGG